MASSSSAAHSSASSSAASAAAASTESSDPLVHELRPLLHKLWSATNAVLRRQAAYCAEILWAPPKPFKPFISQACLHRQHRMGAGRDGSAGLLLQLVQFCRLLQRLLTLVGAPMPPLIEAAIARFTTRAQRATPPSARLRHRILSASSTASEGSLASHYPPLCVIDLLATQLARSGATSGGGGGGRESAHSEAREVDTDNDADGDGEGGEGGEGEGDGDGAANRRGGDGGGRMKRRRRGHAGAPILAGSAAGSSQQPLAEGVLLLGPRRRRKQ